MNFFDYLEYYVTRAAEAHGELCLSDNKPHGSLHVETAERTIDGLMAVACSVLLGIRLGERESYTPHDRDYRYGDLVTSDSLPGEELVFLKGGFGETGELSKVLTRDSRLRYVEVEPQVSHDWNPRANSSLAPFHFWGLPVNVGKGVRYGTFLGFAPQNMMRVLVMGHDAPAVVRVSCDVDYRFQETEKRA